MKSFFYLIIFLLSFIFAKNSLAECGDSVVVVITNSTSIYGSSTHKTIYIYDSTANLKSRTHQMFENGDWENKSKSIVLYDSVGHIIQEIQLEATDFGWDTSSCNYKSYNSHGDIIERFYKNNWNGPFENASRSTYTYDNFY